MTTIVSSTRRHRWLVAGITATLVGVAIVAAGSSRAAGYPVAPPTVKLKKGGTINVL